MRIEYGEPKRQRNLQKHGFDFADFERCFDRDSAVRIATSPSSTGRARYLLIGRWNDELVVLAVISPLGSEALSLVSLRRASRLERDTYDRYREGWSPVDYDF
ncbi:BrnT family toxin [Methylobacterium frigidaeris]|uniref:BrnT family toxin n=1 Tax=Methylobacterium frigidaeris TaxID=2038277 RepID=A0AA37M7A8_9HYPH|nr:BrnT family toxin [Methylobacterium frigidaeris]GJD64406.1 hypothetical protein MPEAHAMD_4588 [Methylobacterium frigidaeris]